LVAPGGSPDADRFRPLRSGGSTSSLINALLIEKLLQQPNYFFNAAQRAVNPLSMILLWSVTDASPALTMPPI
jgi:hypothetical protein